MKIRKKAQEQLKKRNLNRTFREANVRNRGRIDKRKYFGIGKQIKKYTDSLRNSLFDKDLFREAFEGVTNLTDSFEKYLSLLSVRFEDLSETIQDVFDVSFEKGTRRVQDKNGEPITFSQDIVDVNALDEIKADQLRYVKNITTEQRKIIEKQITGAIESGASIEETSKAIEKKMGNFTKGRATTIARTELVKAHNIGQVETMRSLGVETYIYWTTGDKKVSDICKKNQGPRKDPHVYDLNRAGTVANPLPVLQSHPNCRCTILVND